MSGGDKDTNTSRGGKARTWNGRYVNIAHRRTPSELTPLIQQNLALQQQVELLTAQNQHMMHQQMQPSNVGGPNAASQAQAGGQFGAMGYVGQPQLLPPPPQVFHQRGASHSSAQLSPSNSFHARQRSMGHVRRHSLAVSEAKRAAQERSSGSPNLAPAAPNLGPFNTSSAGTAGSSGNNNNSGGNSGGSNSNSNSNSSSGGNGSPGPLIEPVGQFRFPPSPDRPQERHTRGHSRSHSSSSAFRRQTPSPQRFQFPPTPENSSSSSSGNLAPPPPFSSFGGGPGGIQTSNAPSAPISQNLTVPFELSSSPSHSRTFSHGRTPSYGGGGSFGGSGGGSGHTRKPSNWEGGFGGHRPRQSNASEFTGNNAGGGNAGAGRKSLFVPYLPQSAIPEMLAEGLLVTGTLRVNHKNRSYAYVTTDLLDADVFIAGSKDRNRALEGDLVAVELLDVDDVWEQKREKEERKRRRGGGGGGNDNNNNDGRLVETQEGQLRRRGSLKERAPQKRSDDVEVEGQTLLLREDLGSGEEKPLYAGHVVAILERPAGQLFSGTLGLLRPSSQANKERQQHSRQASSSSVAAPEDQQQTTNTNNKPKIVWFKPVDKCVPLMAVPTEQAPPDLVDNPQAYADQIFVAQIKRWPITSLHPFGMLVEKLGTFGDPEVSQKAVLRDFNFGAHKFSDAAVAEAVSAGKAMVEAAEHLPSARAEKVSWLAPDLAASIYENDGEQIVAVHVLDITPFIERNGMLDRELRHKSSGVYMDQYESPLVSSPEAFEHLQFKEDVAAPAITVELARDSGTVTVKREKVVPEKHADATAKFESIASVLRRRRGLGSIDDPTVDLSSLLDVCVPARAPLSDAPRSETIINELVHAVNAAIASELLRSSAVGLNTLVRRQADPPIHKLEQLAGFLRRQGVRVDTTNAHTLVRSLAEELSPRQRSAIKASLGKILSPQRYALAARTNPGQLGHYWFGFDAYTHFARPLLRYADQVVARQVHTMLGTQPPTNDPQQFVSGAAELAPELSFRYDCAHGVQEQSFHLSLSRQLTSSYQLFNAVVTTVYESAFDVVIPEMSLEKRVHGDQLPLSKAEFHPNSQLLELFWTPGVDSASFEPETTAGSNDEDGATAGAAESAGGARESFAPLAAEIKEKLVLRHDTHVQEIRPLCEIPVLVRIVADMRVLPSIIVRAANPFL